MKTNTNLRLRRMGTKYMMVRVQSRDVNLTEVYTLNRTAAELWQWVQGREFTAAELAEYLCGRYGIEMAQAQADVERLLHDWDSFGLLSD